MGTLRPRTGARGADPTHRKSIDPSEIQTASSGGRSPRNFLVEAPTVPTRARLYGVAPPSPNRTWSKPSSHCAWQPLAAGLEIPRVRCYMGFARTENNRLIRARAAGFMPDVCVPRYAQYEHITIERVAGRSPCRSCKPSAPPPHGRRSRRPPPPPQRAASACCRCHRSNGMPRSSARPLTSMSGSRPSSLRSSGRSSRPT